MSAFDKHKLNGIGGASATAALAALSTTGAVWLTTGIIGKIVVWLLTELFSRMASAGLVTLNIGASKVQTLLDKNDFDGSFESAEKYLKAIRDTGREITPAEALAIDAPVIKSFRKFASFARKK